MCLLKKEIKVLRNCSKIQKIVYFVRRIESVRSVDISMSAFNRLVKRQQTLRYYLSLIVNKLFVHAKSWQSATNRIKKCFFYGNYKNRRVSLFQYLIIRSHPYQAYSVIDLYLQTKKLRVLNFYKTTNQYEGCKILSKIWSD